MDGVMSLEELPGMFTEAKESVLHLMTTDTWRRFIQSEDYAALIQAAQERDRAEVAVAQASPDLAAGR